MNVFLFSAEKRTSTERKTERGSEKERERTKEQTITGIATNSPPKEPK